MSMVFAGFMQAAREDRLKREEREAEEKAAEEAFAKKKELLGLQELFKQKREDRELARDVEAAAMVMGVEGDAVSQIAPYVQALGKTEAIEAWKNGDLTIEGGTTTSVAPEEIGSMLVRVNEQYQLPEGYLYTIADIESGFDPAAQNPNSSAGGLLQQTDANASQYGVADRFNPVESAVGGARFAVDNMQTLRSALGRDPTAAELYVAHQQGPGGASALLSNPSANVLDALAPAYNGDRGKARRAILDNGGSLDMTAGEFAGMWMQKYNERSSTYDPNAFSDVEGTKTAPEGFTLSDTQPPQDDQMAVLGFGENTDAAVDGSEEIEQEASRQPLNMGVRLDSEVEGPGMTVREPVQVSFNRGQPESDLIGMSDNELADIAEVYKGTPRGQEASRLLENRRQGDITDPSDIGEAALELAQAKDSGDPAAIKKAQLNYDTLLREEERKQAAALDRERMAGTGAAPLIEAVVTDPRTNERRIEAVTIDPVSDTYTARDGTALDSSQVQGLTDQELDLYGKIPSQTITDSRRLRDSATSVIRMLDVGIDAIEIAERNPNVLGVRGSAASAATGFVRGVSGIVDVASEILQRQDSVTLQELEAELRSEGQLAEGQSLTQMDDRLLNALIPESIQGDARDRAILDSKLVLMAFRSGGLEGQSGNAMSNQDFNRLKDAVAKADGNPEVFRSVIGDYIRGTIQAHDAQVQQFSVEGPVGAFFERTGVMPIPVPQTVGDVVTASGNQKLMRSYQTFSEGMSQDTELSQSATPTGDAEGQAGLSQEEIIGIIEPFNREYGPAARDRMQTKPPEERLEYMKNVAEELGVPLDSLRPTVFYGIEIPGGTE